MDCRGGARNGERRRGCELEADLSMEQRRGVRADLRDEKDALEGVFEVFLP